MVYNFTAKLQLERFLDQKHAQSTTCLVFGSGRSPVSSQRILLFHFTEGDSTQNSFNFIHVYTPNLQVTFWIERLVDYMHSLFHHMCLSFYIYLVIIYHGNDRYCLPSLSCWFLLLLDYIHLLLRQVSISFHIYLVMWQKNHRCCLSLFSWFVVYWNPIFW